eukprot:CCRYP_012371-RA/>CCRYP_012371-RA protein AED:0.29 eAED:0.41 QI:0/-1/0/1/-1/1/1/0/197
MKTSAIAVIATATIFTATPSASAFVLPTSNRASGATTNQCKQPPSGISSRSPTPLHNGPSSDSILNDTAAVTTTPEQPPNKFRMAQSLLLSLINDEQCFTTFEGAQKFADSCALNIIYEDCYEPQPIVGRSAVANHLRARISQRTGKDAHPPPTKTKGETLDSASIKYPMDPPPRVRMDMDDRFPRGSSGDDLYRIE